MSKGFTCVKCGNGSLVRSNFKATPRGNYYCASEALCHARLKKEIWTTLEQDVWTGCASQEDIDTHEACAPNAL